ncbi:MAG: toxin TcdB middle/N-terminal domain-containing protein, partial [Myxococcota bacterium]
MVVRNEQGQVRDFDRGANDWFVALGDGTGGWSPLQRWTMPSRRGANLGLTGVDYIHNTQMLRTTVTDYFLDSDFYAHQGGLAVTIPVTLNPAKMAAGVSNSLVSAGLSVGGVSVGGLLQSPVSTAASVACSTRSAPAGACQAAQAMGSMVMSQGLATMNALNMMTGMPHGVSTGAQLGLRINAHGLHLNSIYVPILGDLLSYDREQNASESYQYQGMADLDGDGRLDFISTRFDDGTSEVQGGEELNAPNTWLFYRNTGQGFASPVPWRIAPDAIGGLVDLFEVPESYLDKSDVYRGAMHIDYQKRWNDKEFAGGSIDALNYSENIQRLSLLDINSDGLLDLVGQDFHVGGQGEERYHYLTVYYNLGDQFGPQTHMALPGFEGLNQGSPGTLSGVTAYPSMTVGGEVLGNVALSRQVQGLFDVNQDGLLDYYFIPPQHQVTHMAHDGAMTQHSSYFGTPDGTDELPREMVSPTALNAPIYVSLNQGRQFAEPVEWVGSDAYALSGGIHDTLHARRYSVAYTTLGDFDHDGQVELAVRDPAKDHFNTDDREWETPVQYALYELHRPQVDMLKQITNPFGGETTVDYALHWDEGRQMPSPVWVTESITFHDIDPTRQDIARNYVYEHGRYDQEWKSFRGFERIYTYADEQGGWTMTRYLQERGFEHLPYCTEVREHTLAVDLSPMLMGQAATRASAWKAAASTGGVRSGYTRALVYGDASKMQMATPVAEHDPEGDDATEVYDGFDPNAWSKPFSIATTDADEMDDSDYEPIVTDLNEPNRHEMFSEWTSGPIYKVPGPPRDGSFSPATDITLDYSLGAQADRTRITTAQWSDCPSSQATTTDVGTVVVSCPDMMPTLVVDASCGDDDEPGRLLKQTRHIYQDYSALPGLLNTRLVENHTWLYDSTGTQARHTAESFTYDVYGNTTTVAYHGDVDVVDDGHVQRIQYAINPGA